MKKFKYPLAIKGEEKELETLIQKLEQFGYALRGHHAQRRILVTNQIGINGDLLYYDIIDTSQERTEVPASSPDLVLALAAMVDDDKIYTGEYFVCHTDLIMQNGDGAAYTCGKMYKSEKDGCITDNFELKEHWMESYTDLGLMHKYFSKATREQILDHFNQEKADDITHKLNAEFIDSQTKQPIAYKVVTNMLHWKYGTILVKQSTGQYAPEGAIVGEICIGIEKYLKDTDLLEPIYSEEPKVIKVLMHSEPDNFELEVSKDGIYYRPENTFLNESDIHSIVSLEKRVKTYNGNKQYTFIPSHFDSGCKRMVPREDWMKVLSAYYSIIHE